jgi:hypothetical protein
MAQPAFPSRDHQADGGLRAKVCFQLHEETRKILSMFFPELLSPFIVGLLRVVEVTYGVDSDLTKPGGLHKALQLVRTKIPGPARM